ncbi:MAG: DUF4160 domain-containing protein [Prevotellaceae bacterium]|jgi:hypothetical protein|nr:DUF4160 domain-containing protein [Prevotellaceae bacterium]
MLKIFEYFGFVFNFYPNEYEPIRVHVTYQNCEAVFVLTMSDGALEKVRHYPKEGANSLLKEDAETAERFIWRYSSKIVSKWIKFFVLKQPVKNMNITRKL